MPSAVLFSSKDQNWETPQALFDKLNSTYHFTLDACATAGNAKCEKFFSPEDDGLKQSWSGHTVWMNPPYAPARKACHPKCKKVACEKRGNHQELDTPGQYAWVKKAYEEVYHGDCQTVVCLLPARTDTKLFHSFVMNSSLVVFLQGRLRFVGAKDMAVFPSMLVTFERWDKPRFQRSPLFTSMRVK